MTLGSRTFPTKVSMLDETWVGLVSKQIRGLSKMAWKSCEVLDPRRKFVAMVRTGRRSTQSSVAGSFASAAWG